MTRFTLCIGFVVFAMVGLTQCSAKTDSQQSVATAGNSGSAVTAGAAGTASGGTASGGTASGGTAGALGTAGTSATAGAAGSSSCGPAVSTAPSRASETCPVTMPEIDAGVTSCATDADCMNADANSYCHDNSCRVDQCLSDTDCPSGEACGCASQFAGNAFHVNRCVPGNCRTDADCGTEACSATVSPSACGGLGGYYCHTTQDKCHSSTDCCQSTPICAYQSGLGYWACQAITVCNG